MAVPRTKHADASRILGPWPLPGWLPDETLFSLASRYHLMSGHRLPEYTNQALFGGRRAGAHHDFPCPLTAFVERTEGRLGSVAEIARHRTVLSYYLPHRDLDLAEYAVEALAQPERGMLKFRLGLLTSRFRANHPLKACPGCMADDVARHGIAYWHREHQLPGIWICRRHDVLLREATVKFNGVERFGWVLPSQETLAKPIDREVPAASRMALRRFADLTIGWDGLPPASLDCAGMARALRTRLAQGPQKLARTEQAELYCQAMAPLRIVGEFNALPRSADQAIHQVNRWVHLPQGTSHPIRHLSFFFWLFKDWADFESTYERCGRSDDSAITTPVAREAGEPRDPRREEVVRRIVAGEAPSGVARATGISVQTAIAWATAAGIACKRRPKTLKAESYDKLVTALRRGDDKAAAAQALEVSIQTITRVLRSEPGLRDAWRQARHSAAQDMARSAWSGAIEKYPALGIKFIREFEPSAYAWLYRNDRSWLRQTNAAIKVPRTHSSRVDWDRRDIELSDAVRKVAADIVSSRSDTGRGGQVKLWQLCQAIPELKAKLNSLPHLPLTARAIEAATRAAPRQDRSADLFKPRT